MIMAAAPKLLIPFSRVLHFTQDFVQYRVVCNRCASRCQTFSTRKTSVFEDDNSAVKSKQQRPKTIPIPKITLISSDGSMTVTELENAQRLAKRRNLILIKVSDITENKTQRSVYKLGSNSTLIDEIEHDEIIKENKQKSIKILYISTRIAEHDLQTKLRNVVKLLKKGHKVKIVLTLNDDNPDLIKSTIETTVKNDGNIQQMPSKKNTVLLLITPLSKDKDSSMNNKKENNMSETIN